MSNADKSRKLWRDMNEGNKTPKEVQREAQFMIDEQCPIPFGRPKYSKKKPGKGDS